MIPSADLHLLFTRQQQTSAVVQAREIITQGKTEFTASLRDRKDGTIEESGPHCCSF